MAGGRKRKRSQDPARVVRTKNAARRVSTAGTARHRYVIKRASSGRWELRIYERETDSPKDAPAPFASHILTRDTKAECAAIARAFQNLGDSYNEFRNGYRSRLDQAVADAAAALHTEQSRSASSGATRAPASPKGAGIAPPARHSGTSPVPHGGEKSPARRPGDAASPASTRGMSPAAPDEPRSRDDHVPSRRRNGAVPPPPRANPAFARAVAERLRRPVFVDARAGHYHAHDHCVSKNTVQHRCTAEQAHHSRLAPCPKCTRSLVRFLNRCLGVITAETRMRHPLPPLTPHAAKPAPKRPKSAQRSAGHSDTGRRHDRAGGQAREIPYGRPSRADDLRFNHRSRLDWGSASYGQNPEEFLGSPTDDDNDWRGNSALYE